MLCQICGKNPATVHFTEIHDNQMSEVHVCQGCAQEKGDIILAQAFIQGSDARQFMNPFGNPFDPFGWANWKNCEPKSAGLPAIIDCVLSRPLHHAKGLR